MTQTSDVKASFCDRHSNILSKVYSWDGIFLAELHGQTQSAELLHCILQKLTKEGTTVSLSLEIRPGVEGFSEHWEAGLKGLSVGSPELRCVVEAAASNDKISTYGHKVPVIFNLDGTIQLIEAEKAWGEQLLEDWKDGSYLVALAGNLHASRATWTENGREGKRTGAFLPESVAIISLKGLSGKVRQCQITGCDVYDVRPSEYEAFSLIDPTNSVYDYIYTVPEFNATSDYWDIEICSEFFNSINNG